MDGRKPQRDSLRARGGIIGDTQDPKASTQSAQASFNDFDQGGLYAEEFVGKSASSAHVAHLDQSTTPVPVSESPMPVVATEPEISSSPSLPTEEKECPGPAESQEEIELSLSILSLETEGKESPEPVESRGKTKRNINEWGLGVVKYPGTIDRDSDQNSQYNNEDAQDSHEDIQCSREDAQDSHGSAQQRATAHSKSPFALHDSHHSNHAVEHDNKRKRRKDSKIDDSTQSNDNEPSPLLSLGISISVDTPKQIKQKLAEPTPSLEAVNEQSVSTSKIQKDNTSALYVPPYRQRMSRSRFESQKVRRRAAFSVAGEEMNSVFLEAPQKVCLRLKASVPSAVEVSRNWWSTAVAPSSGTQMSRAATMTELRSKVRRGLIVYLPAKNEIKTDSVIHDHPDFQPEMNAWAHPALIYRILEGKDLCVCLKITSWSHFESENSQIPPSEIKWGKWGPYFPKHVGSKREQRRALYIPIQTNDRPEIKTEALKMTAPLVQLEDGKSFPLLKRTKMEPKFNRSYINVERTFKVEIENLRPWQAPTRMNENSEGEKLKLQQAPTKVGDPSEARDNGRIEYYYLTKKSLEEIKKYRQGGPASVVLIQVQDAMKKAREFMEKQAASNISGNQNPIYHQWSEFRQKPRIGEPSTAGAPGQSLGQSPWATSEQTLTHSRMDSVSANASAQSRDSSPGIWRQLKAWQASRTRVGQ